MLISAKQVSSEVLTTDSSKIGVAPYNALGQRIVNVADPVDPQDVVTLGSLSSQRVVDVWHQMTFATANLLPPLAGVATYYNIPLGNMFLDAASDVRLWLANSPKGPSILRTYGVDYTGLRRAQQPGGQVETVRDAAIGVRFLFTPAMAGLPGNMQWRERHLLLPAPTLAKVRVEPDPTNGVVGILAENVTSTLPSSQPSVPTSLSVTFPVGWNGGNVTVDGTAPGGGLMSEIFNFFSPGTVQGNSPFLTITNIVNSSPGGTGAESALVKTRQTRLFSAPIYTQSWYQQPISTTYPNAISTPAEPGLQLEFWRRSLKNGGVRMNANPNLKRMGRRYVPYYRAPVDQFVVYAGTFNDSVAPPYSNFLSAQQKHKHFRVCYYDPTTGARSPLSNDVIVVGSNTTDRISGLSAPRRQFSLWIQ